ncbi:MAG: SPFH domain-containing protein [Saprospiraceae bacterium]|jgi:membrane protease subunit (stomatin/prohibitin family)|nr:SPFH domain-containing protein [Saprospiraceae bacterium]
MGLFDFIKNELVEVIDWIEDDRDTVIHKWPHDKDNIKYGANLIVREAQTALFVNEGVLADTFEPGRFELVTANMPLLTSLKNWDKGFKSPFKVDVYYVSTRQFTGLKWGTPNPIILRDPEFKQVRVKAFGVYFIRVKHPDLFFREFAGTARTLKIQELEEKLRELVSPKFAEAIANANVSVMDMVANYTELGDRIAPLLQADFDAFGLELTKFQISSTSLPKEVEEFYDKMTNMNMVGDMNKFQQFQTAQAIENASNNPGGAGEGLGMGMGFGMAQTMMQQQQQMQQQQANEAQNQNTANTTQSKEDIMKLLKDLGELKTAGILTDEEFDAKKKELLAKL